MPRINSRAKGASGEREFCGWLFKNFDQLEEKPERNLDQVRNGGTDVIVPPFCFEVKRRENLDLLAAWIQVKKDVELIARTHGRQHIPVVAFRFNRKPWEFLISANYIGCGMGFVRLDERTFIMWANKMIDRYTSNVVAIESVKKLESDF